ncbi:hypothetical protein [Microbacterium sp. H1-D42]|uniref:hypothetical protein n=1 Tax=Microbacterium sp. H1-D42 TaxID=2925844 RepID=UPI001F53029C|nr:hypothetical protein [Microbacterium sp. H1-D42]UNK72132.1 hypothetical protein MNR00_06735 [Microbacterium sp. H1-D42]
MSFENANGFPEERRTGAPSSEHAGEELGWLSTVGAGHDPRVDESSSRRDADAAVLYEDQVQPETGILGFTLRELLMVGAWLVAFAVSFFPLSVIGGSIWTNGIGWILAIGLPTIAVFLVVLRRFSPDGIRRVGSLGIDQFASVAASVAAVAWAQLLWSQIAATMHSGLYVVGWVVIVAQLATLALVATTVAAPLIPRLREDFEGRMETLAHRNANPVRPVVARPRAERVAAAPMLQSDDASASETTDAPAADSEATGSGATDAGATDVVQEPVPVVAPAVVADIAPLEIPQAHEPEPEPEKDHYTDPVGVLQDIFASDDDATAQLPVIAESQASSAPAMGEDQADVGLRRSARADVSTDPFWVLAMTDRDVYDEHGQALFRIGPTAWTLVIEDRGGAYVVRHEDGRIGYLHDITDITKG